MLVNLLVVVVFLHLQLIESSFYTTNPHNDLLRDAKTRSEREFAATNSTRLFVFVRKWAPHPLTWTLIFKRDLQIRYEAPELLLPSKWLTESMSHFWRAPINQLNNRQRETILESRRNHANFHLDHIAAFALAFTSEQTAGKRPIFRNSIMASQFIRNSKQREAKQTASIRMIMTHKQHPLSREPNANQFVNGHWRCLVSLPVRLASGRLLIAYCSSSSSSTKVKPQIGILAAKINLEMEFENAANDTKRDYRYSISER